VKTASGLGFGPRQYGSAKNSIVDSFKPRAACGYAIPLLALVIEADNGDAAGHLEKVAEAY
jgi:hypothetical protein